MCFFPPNQFLLPSTPPTEIDKKFTDAIAFVSREGKEEKELLMRIAATGTNGFYAWDKSDKDIVRAFLERGSEATLLRIARSSSDVSIHHYSHALSLLQGLVGPEPNVEQTRGAMYVKINKVKEKVKEMFGMNTERNSV